MKPTKSLGQVLALVAAASPVIASWPGFLPDLDSLVARHPNALDNAIPEPTELPSSKQRRQDGGGGDGGSGGDNGGDNGGDSGGSSTSSSTKKDDTKTSTKEDDKGSSTKSSTTSHKTYAATASPASVNMLTPAITDAAGLYMIEAPTPISWVWNYTHLQGTPSAINVAATNSEAQLMITITSNMTFKETPTVTWDVKAYQESALDNRLIVDTYQLMIWDADYEPTETPDNGYLPPYSGTQFGLYTNKPYSDTTENWKCIVCSAALGSQDRQALGMALGMGMITVLSFTWYVAGFAGLMG